MNGQGRREGIDCFVERVCMKGKKEFMVMASRKKWTLEGSEGSDRLRKGKCASEIVVR